MKQTGAIRRRKRSDFDRIALRWLLGAACFVFLSAFAVAGLPADGRGFAWAEAFAPVEPSDRGAALTNTVDLRVRDTIVPGPFQPQVIFPITPHEMPAWLILRGALKEAEAVSVDTPVARSSPQIAIV